LRVAMVDHSIDQACELVADELLCTIAIDLVIGAGWYGYVYIATDVYYSFISCKYEGIRYGASTLYCVERDSYVAVTYCQMV
jgi:hypothetical protein